MSEQKPSLFAVACGIVAAWGFRKGLNYLPISKPFSDGAVVFLIWVFSIAYFARIPRLDFDPPKLEEEVGRWLLSVGLPWAICSLGLPMVLPRLWAAVLAGLRDGATQWLLTVFAAVLSYAAFTVAQVLADVMIQMLLQTHPDQFPGAQRALTALGAIYIWIAVFCLLAVLALFLVPAVEMRTSKKPIVSLTAAFSLLAAIYFVPLSTAMAFRDPKGSDGQGDRAKRGPLEERLILWTSFTPNRMVEGQIRNQDGGVLAMVRLVCRNLPDDAKVAFVHPDEVMPDKVVVAEPRSGDIPDRAPAFTYRLARCENSNNPDDVG